MDSYHIRGGRRIGGKLTVSGAKNAALPILAAAILPGNESFLENCPAISDVENMLRILRQLGCGVKAEAEGILVDSSTLDCHIIPHGLMGEMRSSVFLMGPLLARCGEVVLGQPGGCDIGKRPIDLHLSALRKMGAEIINQEDSLICRAKKLRGADIQLEFPSVGATENIMLAAVFAEGESIIRGSAREPEIVDLQKYLVSCGALISGAGTDEILIKGTNGLSGTRHRIIPDRIEAGTYLAAAAATGGEILLEDVRPEHMESLLSCLSESGCYIKRFENKLLLSAPDRLSAVDSIATKPFPGFPTDMQSQFLTLMTIAKGVCHIREEIFENRFKQVPELLKMGASIAVAGRTATVTGVEKLKGAVVSATDLRGGAAMVIAGLAAEGKTVVKNIDYIERGYDQLPEVLRILGADIEKQTEEDTNGERTED